MASTRFRSDGSRGEQRPRICHVPDYVSSAGREAIDLAALAGLELDEWQRFVLLHSMGEQPDGKWAAFEVGLCVGRQNGKGSVLEARELWGLFVGGEREIVHSAHEQLTATNHFRRLLGLIRNVPELDRRVLKAPQGKGAEAIELHDGARILFKTRTSDAGRGLTGDLVVLDEAMNIQDAAMAALVPTMAARSITGNPQLWYAGSAVDTETDQHGVPFSRIRERGIAGTGRIAYFEWSAESPNGDDPGRVPEALRRSRTARRQANPGYGIRISDEHIDNECNGALSVRKFCVERLGVGLWADTSEDSGRVIAAAAWANCAEHDRANRIVTVQTFAFDCSVDQSWASIGAAGFRVDGLPQVAVEEHARSTAWVVPRLLQIRDEHVGCRFVGDPGGPAANLVRDAKDAGLDVIEVSTGDYGDACADFLAATATVPVGVRYPAPQPELDDAVKDARTQGMGDRWKWSRRKSASADITPLVAVTLAMWGAQHAEEEFTTVLFPNRPEPEERERLEREALGPQVPVILTPADYTTCFRCATGSPCELHPT